MIKIQVSADLWGTFESSYLYAQNMTTKDVICETETPPSEYVEIEEIPMNFMQLIHEGKFGEYMTFAEIGYVTYLKEWCTADDISNATDFDKQMQHITDKRKNPTYKTSQIISLVLTGFLLRIQSFNQLNSMIETGEFKGSYIYIHKYL